LQRSALSRDQLLEYAISRPVRKLLVRELSCVTEIPAKPAQHEHVCAGLDRKLLQVRRYTVIQKIRPSFEDLDRLNDLQRVADRVPERLIHVRQNCLALHS